MTYFGSAHPGSKWPTTTWLMPTGCAEFRNSVVHGGQAETDVGSGKNVAFLILPMDAPPVVKIHRVRSSFWICGNSSRFAQIRVFPALGVRHPTHDADRPGIVIARHRALLLPQIAREDSMLSCTSPAPPNLFRSLSYFCSSRPRSSSRPMPRRPPSLRRLLRRGGKSSRGSLNLARPSRRTRRRCSNSRAPTLSRHQPK